MRPLTAADPETKSADLVAENVARLRELYPEAFTEGKVDFDVLRQLLGNAVEEREEKYGLNWHGKRRARQLALTPSTGTLRPCPEESVDWETTQNLMIEGDNLEVLKLLQKSYAGKVKLIYIDPPYNTGKDFVYPDDFRDNIRNYLELTGQIEGDRKITSNTEASGRFHTDWLNMIYPRLKLARNLLRDNGMILVTVDDGEVANLRSTMDEVFGSENFLACIAWEKRYTRSNNARLFYSLKDNIVVYRRSEALSMLREPRTHESKEIYSNPDGDFRGEWTSSSYVNPATKEDRKNLVYPIKNPFTGQMIEHPTHAWKYEHSEHLRHVAEKRLWWGQSGDAKFPRLKNFLAEMNDGLVPIDVWDYASTGTTDEGGLQLKALFGEAVFDNPKPTKLVRRMLGLGTKSDAPDIVVDFFAGSGSTGHAVCEQNLEDGGNRRFIMVQLPEPTERKDFSTIASITKERLRRSAKKILELNPLYKGDLGFRVFKLDASNIRAWEPDREKLAATIDQYVEHLRADRTEQDILFELLLKLGLDLCTPIESRDIAGLTVHSIGAGTLIACLAARIATASVEPLALGIAAWHTEQAPAGDTTLVFRDSAFENDVAKTNLTAILNQHGLENVRSL